MAITQAGWHRWCSRWCVWGGGGGGAMPEPEPEPEPEPPLSHSLSFSDRGWGRGLCFMQLINEQRKAKAPAPAPPCVMCGVGLRSWSQRQHLSYQVGRIPWPPREISGEEAQARTRFSWG
jgi:hypothetical protein